MDQTNSRSEAEIQNVVRAGLPGLIACYRTRLESHPDLAGRISLKVIIAPKGTVRAVRVTQNTTLSEELADCVSENVRQWHFQETAVSEDDSISLTLPFSPDK